MWVTEELEHYCLSLAEFSERSLFQSLDTILVKTENQWLEYWTLAGKDPGSNFCPGNGAYWDSHNLLAKPPLPQRAAEKTSRRSTPHTA